MPCALCGEEMAWAAMVSLMGGVELTGELRERVNSCCLQGASPGPPLERSSTNSGVKLEVGDMCSCLEQSQTAGYQPVSQSRCSGIIFFVRVTCAPSSPSPIQPQTDQSYRWFWDFGCQGGGEQPMARTATQSQVPASELARRRGNRLEKWGEGTFRRPATPSPGSNLEAANCTQPGGSL